MALSDTCSEVSWQLASDIVHYLDWGYGIEDISNLVDVVFSLASFQAKHDAPFMNAQEQKNGIDRMVISMFKDFLEDTDKAIGCLSEKKKATDRNQWLFHFGGPTRT